MTRDSWSVSSFPKQTQDCLGQELLLCYVLHLDVGGYMLSRGSKYVCHNTTSKNSKDCSANSENKQPYTQNSKSLFTFSCFPFGAFRMQTLHSTVSLKVKIDFKQFEEFCVNHLWPLWNMTQREVTLVYNTFSLLATDFDCKT